MLSGHGIQAVQSPDDRVDDCARHVRGIRRRDDLADEVRIPSREREDAIGVEAALPGQHPDGRGREPSHRDVPHVRLDVAEHAGERMIVVQLVVPVRDHQDRGKRADATREEPQGVEGRLVGPVDVLHHQHGARP